MNWQVAAAMFMMSLAFVVYLFVTAPEGYEDETGFHYGRKDDEPYT